MSTPCSLARRAISESHHLRAAAGGGAGGDGLLDQAERAGADGVAHLQVAEAPLLLEPGAPLARRLGQRRRAARSTHSRDGATGTRSGSGK